MKKRSIRIPLVLVCTAFTGGGLGAALSCGGATEPNPCPGTCADAAADSAPDHVTTDTSPEDVIFPEEFVI
jgi:hypothetical protein